MHESVGSWKYEEVVYRQSFFAKDEQVVDNEKSHMRCPRCGTGMAILEHDQKTACPQCSLKIHKLGASLDLSE